jgi:hypothetical protein
VRRRKIYIDKYGPVAGGKLYHALQSQAAHAGVSARLRRKLKAITGGRPWPPAKKSSEPLPLFPEDMTADAATQVPRVGDANGDERIEVAHRPASPFA